MARSIPKGMAGILERLELNRPELVAIRDLEEACSEEAITTSVRVVASRLRDHGWLLPTSQRGVWEFVPAEAAGAYSTHDPLMSLKAFSLANPDIEYAASSQTAAWALGLADRAPARLDVVFSERPKVKVPDGISFSTFQPNILVRTAKGVHVLAPESIVVCMAAKPALSLIGFELLDERAASFIQRQERCDIPVSLAMLHRLGHQLGVLADVFSV